MRIRILAIGLAWMASLCGQHRRFSRRATTSVEHSQNAWYNLAPFYAARNDAGAAESSLRAAIAHAPKWFKPHWTLAKLLEATGRLPEAALEALAAVTFDGGKHPEVSETLARIRWAQVPAP